MAGKGGQGQALPLRELVAARIGCAPGELINYREAGEEVIALGPDGRKYRFAKAELAGAVTAEKAEPRVAPLPLKVGRGKKESE